MVEMNDANGVQDQSFIGVIKRVNDGERINGFVTSIKHYVPCDGYVESQDRNTFEKDGKKYILKSERSVPNTITNLGNAMAARRFLSAAETLLLTHMAVGTDTGAKTSASTTLEHEVGRVALDTLTCPVAGAANDNVVTAVATFPAGTGTGALVEAGMFTATPAGTMFCYTDFGVVTKAAADIVMFTWTITFGTT